VLPTSNVIYSSGLCEDCFTVVVRDKQIEKHGDFCFASDKECPKPSCTYQEKCTTIRKDNGNGCKKEPKGKGSG
jgi:hypothetical protein